MMEPYILWIDYGVEGWRYEPFHTLAEVANHIRSGNTFGHRFLIIWHVPFVIADTATDE